MYHVSAQGVNKRVLSFITAAVVVVDDYCSGPAGEKSKSITWCFTPSEPFGYVGAIHIKTQTTIALCRKYHKMFEV